MKPSRLAALALACCALSPVSGPAAVAAPGDTAVFDVIRDGDRIGSHTLVLDHEGADTVARIKTAIAVKVAFVTVYRFEHESREDWRGGRLVSFSSTTNDDGTRHQVSMQAVPQGIRITADGHAQTVQPAPLGSLWRGDMVGAPDMINTLDGSVMHVVTRELGTETVSVAGSAVPARHVHIDGDLVRDVWYGPAGDLVKVRFPAKDGSIVEYHRAS